jgi:DNA-directed RNA polymerase sigma subunit (sigma70/sigma32)
MKDGLLKCSRHCMNENIECDNKECRLWIDYKEEYNCSLISIYEHGPMTLREVAERLGISFARVKQLESRALDKLKKRSVVRDILF